LAPAGSHAYPIAEERKLGERFAIEASSELPLLGEPAVVDFVNRIGARIVARLDAPQPFAYRFSIVRDSQLNAFAVPGGFVYVNSGILLRVANESELAGVLAHEIGHTHAHHIVRQQEKTALLSYAAIAGMLLSVVHPAIGAAAMGAGTAASLQYAREFEQEADYLGVRYMRAAGFDPYGMLTFMKTMWQEQRFMPKDLIPPYMMSHPLTGERISHLEAATKNLPRVAGSEQPTFAMQRMQVIVEALTGEPSAVRRRIDSQGTTGAKATALLGISRLYQGDAGAAVPLLEKAGSEGMKGLEGDLGLAHLRSGDLARALVDLRAAVEADPDDAVSRANLGRVLLAKQDYPAAIRELARAAALAPAIDAVEWDLGQAYGKGGDSARGFYHLARAREMRGEVDQALADYVKATKLLKPGTEEADAATERATALGEIARHRVLGP
jgi:predicted Zn-dependent protease